jgi:hypothetical protein
MLRATMPRVLIASLAAFLTSCGAIRFQRAWSGYEAKAEVRDMQGRWKGEWRSEWNGHSGNLRCLVTREEGERYRAWFYSTYAGIFFFQYETILAVTDEETGTQRFEGQQDLGESVGGVYHYEGRVVHDEFRSTYRAENGDHGVFEMQRVASENP